MPNPKLAAAIAVRKMVHRAGFDLVREDFRYRFVFALQTHGIRAVIDVGANVGQFGSDLRRARYAGAILSVEPLGEAYRRLVRRSSGDPTWTTERAAVSDRPGTLTMNVSANSVSSSVLPMLGEHMHAAPGAGYVATESVPATTVDDLVARHHIDAATTLLKVDVQGYERSVLDGAAHSLPMFAGVRTEMSLVPLYDGQALMPEIVSYLGDHGFDLWFIERGFTDPHTRRLLQVDGVFFRRPPGPAMPPL